MRPKTSPALVDDGRRSEDGEGRGGAKSNRPNSNFAIQATLQMSLMMMMMMTYVRPERPSGTSMGRTHGSCVVCLIGDTAGGVQVDEPPK